MPSPTRSSANHSSTSRIQRQWSTYQSTLGNVCKGLNGSSPVRGSSSLLAAPLLPSPPTSSPSHNLFPVLRTPPPVVSKARGAPKAKPVKEVPVENTIENVVEISFPLPRYVGLVTYFFFVLVAALALRQDGLWSLCESVGEGLGVCDKAVAEARMEVLADSWYYATSEWVDYFVAFLKTGTTLRQQTN